MVASEAVRYAQTADGVSIAYRQMRAGTPIVLVGGFVPIEILDALEGDVSFGLLDQSQRFGVVLYDRRGTGLSDRDRAGFEMEAALADLDAVVDAVGSPVCLQALYQGGPVAITYAVREPSKVRGLVLSATFARGADYLAQPWVRALRAALREDVEVWSFALATIAVRGELPVKRLAELYQQSFDPESTLAAYDSLADHDASDLLGSVQVPTLIVQQPKVANTLLESTRDLAARIPTAELIRDGSDSFFNYSAETKSAIERLGRTDSEALDGPTGMQAVMFTDLVSSTGQTLQLGDEAFHEILKAHNDVVRSALSEHGGVEIKHTGDGIMASFASAADAVGAGLHMCRSFEAAGIEARIGVSAGEPITDDDDLYGTVVQLAARTCAATQPGVVLVTGAVRELAAGKGLRFGPGIEHELKGFPDAVVLYPAIS